MSFRLVPKSVTLNDRERRNGVILRCFSEFGYLPGALRKSSRSLFIVYYATEAAHIIHYTNIQRKTQKIKTSKTIHNTETKFRYHQSEQIHSTLPS